MDRTQDAHIIGSENTTMEETGGLLGPTNALLGYKGVFRVMFFSPQTWTSVTVMTLSTGCSWSVLCLFMILFCVLISVKWCAVTPLFIFMCHASFKNKLCIFFKGCTVPFVGVLLSLFTINALCFIS